MKNKKNNRFSKKIKSEVLEMLKDSGYSVVEVSRAYGISTSTLHKWKSWSARMDQKSSLSSGSSTSPSSAEFVELAVVDSKKVIKKALMVFDDISLSIEGKINSKDLISLISVLESSC